MLLSRPEIFPLLQLMITLEFLYIVLAIAEHMQVLDKSVWKTFLPLQKKHSPILRQFWKQEGENIGRWENVWWQ
jgi:hypothetical protein